MALIQQAKKIRAERSFEIVGLTGGVFKNKRLNEYVNTLLQAEGFKVLMPK
jgi:hydrogenase maturation factor HypF (carbamoyltransferase family)